MGHPPTHPILVQNIPDSYLFNFKTQNQTKCAGIDWLFCVLVGFWVRGRDAKNKLYIKINCLRKLTGGTGMIRTHVGLASMAVFKTAALNHSATLSLAPSLLCADPLGKKVTRLKSPLSVSVHRITPLYGLILSWFTIGGGKANLVWRQFLLAYISSCSFVSPPSV